MGGHAFEQAVSRDGTGSRLSTPRMSPTDYHQLKSIYLERLKAYLPDDQIETLLEAPEKADYGDMDFIIASDEKVDLLQLAQSIGARAIIITGNEKVQRCTLAVLKDGRKSTALVAEYKVAKSPPADTGPVEGNLSQVDIEILPSEIFRWHMFYASYSDLAGLLGKIARPWGFTITDKGLFLRLQELDESKDMPWLRIADAEGYLHMDSDPDKVMRFFALDHERYYKGFTTLQDFYRWLADCRFVSAEVVNFKRDNSNERQKERKRTVYTRFFDEYLPKHFGVSEEESDGTASDSGSGQKEPNFAAKRASYLQEALTTFDKRDEYTSLHQALVLSIKNQTAEYLVKPLVATASGKQGKGLTEILRSFRRWIVIDGDGRADVAGKPHTDQEAQLYRWLGEGGAELRDENAVSRWIESNWDVVRSCERHRGKVGRSE